jgi:eukaryotic-like serine/threonine-protein kinase
VRSALPRDLLHESPAVETSQLRAEREAWFRVRDAVAELCTLPPRERAARLETLRASSDPIDLRVAELAMLEEQAAGFLEVPDATTASHGSDDEHARYDAGDHVGPYRVVSQIGQGGMGRVYLAEDTRLLRRVALKVLIASRVWGATPMREAQMAARLHHHNIATVHDVVEADGRLHIVMEHLEGRTLARVLAEEPLEPPRAADILRKILLAVSHAHRCGVIHCDLKPANVFLLPDDEVKVLDFGLARLAPTSAASRGSSMAVAGTPGYMAPERQLGAHPDRRTDIYSLGVMLSDMLRRSALAQPPDDAATTKLVRSAETALHETLRRMAVRAAAHDPAERFASADDMLHALDATRTTEPTPPAPASAWVKWLAASVGLVLASALLVLLANLARPPQPNPVVAVNLAAVGADPVSGYVAAALQQILERSIGSSPDMTAVRQDAAPADAADLGATHVLAGTVERSGRDLRLSLSVADEEGEVLSSHFVVASLDSLPAVGTALLTVANTVMTRARLPAIRGLNDASVRQALSIDPQAFEEYAQALEYMRARDVQLNVDHAIGLLTRAVDRDPSFALAHAGLAEAYWLKYQTTRDAAWTDRARAAALDALRLNPEDPIVRYTLALIYRGMGRAEDALLEVSKAVALQPSNDDLYRLRGRLHADVGDVDGAIADLNRALELRPGYPENHRAAGLILFAAGRPADAVPYFRRQVELRPSDASAFQALGTAHHAADQIPEALQAYEKALAIAPNANTYSNLATLHYDQGRYEDARRAYEESLRIQPKAPVTQRNLGDTLRKLGREAGARAAYEVAIALSEEQLGVNPSNRDALSLQALCFAKLGHREEAIRLADRVVTSSPLAATPRYRAGVAFVLAGERERGIAEVVRAISDGFSRSSAQRDEDLETVIADPAVAAALKTAAER